MSKHLDNVIERANGEPYKGTSFKKDMCNKFQIPKKDGGQKKEKKQSAADKASPFVEYGFGIKAWINTLLFLFFLFIVLSVFAYGMMAQYANFHGLNIADIPHRLGPLTKYSLGNIGFAQSLCFFQYY